MRDVKRAKRWVGLPLTIRVGAVVTTSVLAAAAGAVAAQPKPSSLYAGRGRVCENNAPGHRYTSCLPKRQEDRFSFRASATARKVIRFAATIGPFYCGGGTNTITVKSMTIGRDGSFSASFSSANRGPTGAVNGTSRVQVRGRFISARLARVFYRLVTHFNHTPSSQDCGAQVSGRARAA